MSIGVVKAGVALFFSGVASAPGPGAMFFSFERVVKREQCFVRISSGLLPMQVTLPWILRPLSHAQHSLDNARIWINFFRIFLVATLLAPCTGQDDGEQESSKISTFCALNVLHLAWPFFARRQRQ